MILMDMEFKTLKVLLSCTIIDASIDEEHVEWLSAKYRKEKSGVESSYYEPFLAICSSVIIVHIHGFEFKWADMSKQARCN